MSFYSRHDYTIDDSVKRRPAAALHTKEMPSTGILCFLTVITRDVDHPCQLWWDWLESDAGSHRIPRWHHPFPCFCGLLADRASRIMSCQLPKAFPVNGMATGHFMRRTPRTKEKFLTHGAVGLILAALAIVVGVQSLVDTHSTIMTVLKIFGSSYTTKAAVRTVIRLFIIRHPEIAYITMIFPKLNTTADTIVSTNKQNDEKTRQV
jgi:hypothetical protein